MSRIDNPPCVAPLNDQAKQQFRGFLMITKRRDFSATQLGAYYNDEKPLGPFAKEHEAARAGLKKWGSSRH
jgi:hypothetical protein